MTQKKDTTMVRIDTAIKNRVAKKVAGTGITIGEYFEGAASDRLKQKTVKPIKNK